MGCVTSLEGGLISCPTVHKGQCFFYESGYGAGRALHLVFGIVIGSISQAEKRKWGEQTTLGITLHVLQPYDSSENRVRHEYMSTFLANKQVPLSRTKNKRVVFFFIFFSNPCRQRFFFGRERNCKRGKEIEIKSK